MILSAISNWTKLLTQENITTVIAILGLVLSLIQFILVALSQRQKLKIELLSWIITDRAVILYLSFINCSRLPVAVTRITLLYDGKEYDCQPTGAKVHQIVRQIERQSGTQVIDRESSYSEPLPINVLSLGAVGGYVLFVVNPQTIPKNATALTFQFCTNRGKKLRKTLQLDQRKIAQGRIP